MSAAKVSVHVLALLPRRQRLNERVEHRRVTPRWMGYNVEAVEYYYGCEANEGRGLDAPVQGVPLGNKPMELTSKPPVQGYSVMRVEAADYLYGAEANDRAELPLRPSPLRPVQGVLSRGLTEGVPVAGGTVATEVLRPLPTPYCHYDLTLPDSNDEDRPPIFLGATNGHWPLEFNCPACHFAGQTAIR